MLVSLQIPQKHVFTDARTPQNISILLNVDNQLFCSASCQYSLIEQSNNSLIDSAMFVGKNGYRRNLTYTIVPPKKGSGQINYQFRAECTNTKTFFCQSPELKRVQSSSITLSYELSLEERDNIKNIQQRALSLTSQYNNLTFKIEDTYDIFTPNKNLFANLNIEADLENINSTHQSSLKQLSKITQLWDEEEFAELTNLLDNLEYIGDDGISRINEIFFKLNQNANNFNETRTILSKFEPYIQSKKEDFNKISIFETTTQEIQLELDSMQTLFNKFNQNNISHTQAVRDYIETNKSIHSSIEFGKQRFSNVIISGKQIYEDQYNESFSTNPSINLSILDQLCINISSIGSNESDKFEQSHCNQQTNIINLSSYNFTLKTIIQSKTNHTLPINLILKSHEPICCLFGECSVCESNDKENTPIVLVHGHAFSSSTTAQKSLSSMSSIHQRMLEEGYIDAGAIYPNVKVTEKEIGSLGKYGKPSIFSTSYYVDENETTLVTSNNESIQEYALRLNSVVKAVQKKTGSEKVIIIAYSMAGLVSREYIRQGTTDVERLIMIGTPNSGVEGSIESLCPFVGQSKECLQMASNSNFINELNQHKSKIPHYVIYGRGCQMGMSQGDGTVITSNAVLEGALNFEITGDCKGSTLHEKLTSVSKTPQVTNTIISILKQ